MSDDTQRDEQIEAEGHLLKTGPERVNLGPERVNVGPERMNLGPERDEEPEVEGHVATPDEKRPPCLDEENEVEGHVLHLGAERAFGPRARSRRSVSRTGSAPTTAPSRPTAATT